MVDLPEFLFAIYNCPETHTIRVKEGVLHAVGDQYNLMADQLHMDLDNGFWVNSFGVRAQKLRIPS